MIKALIFDFDGLILETEFPTYQVWQEVYREYECELSIDQWVLCIGGTLEHFDPYVDLEQKLGRVIPREEIRLRCRERSVKLLETQLVLPGVEQYLLEAKRLGLKVGLASNSSRAWVEGHLSRLGLLEHFECIKTGDQIARAKPAPDLYLSALDCLGVRGEEAIALEDSPHGVRAAQAAGIFCVAVPNVLTGRLSLDHANLRLTSMAALPLEELILAAEKQSTTPLL